MATTPARAMDAINLAFLSMPKEEVKAILRAKYPLSVKHGMTMHDEKGKVEVIDVQLRPWVVSPAQTAFFHRKCLILKSALARVLPMYLADHRVRQILPLDPVEEEWLHAANAKGVQKHQVVVDRLDATATFTVRDWRTSFWFLEPNSVGIGGVHYIPAACALTGDWILPHLKSRLPWLKFTFPDDIRVIMRKLFARHARAIGRKFKRIAFMEDKSEPGGTDEFRSLVRYYKKLGIDAMTVDPSHLRIRKGELTADGKVLDIIYRDTEITEMLEMNHLKRNGEAFRTIREGFIRNQIVSSIAGEFDHKSAWELLTNPLFTSHFTATQRRLFRAHVLWTRLLWQRRTTDPKGTMVDLVQFTRRNRSELVLKPNREYGGQGVVFGCQVSQKEWEHELEKALKKPSNYVIQLAAPVRSELFPVATTDGRVRLRPAFAVTGFAATQDGVAILGRSSGESVVNVSRRGGLIAIWGMK
jgi:hypothetical protein